MNAEYWAEVERLLRTDHHAKKTEAARAVRKFRTHMKSAGPTIYNREPEQVARTIIGHGLIPSLPAVGLNLQVVFKLTDPDKVQANPMAAAKSAAGLIEALDEMERTLGGEGLKLDEAEAVPGHVILSLKPVQALGAAERLKKLSTEVEQASQKAANADAKLTTEVRKRTGAGEQIFVGPHYKAA